MSSVQLDPVLDATALTPVLELSAVRAGYGSIDVLHDFYVPEFRAKMDFVPGLVTYFWLTPSRTGTFDVLCAELCGIGHSQMRGRVVVEEESDYQAWLQKQKTFAELTPQGRTRAAMNRP